MITLSDEQVEVTWEIMRDDEPFASLLAGHDAELVTGSEMLASVYSVTLEFTEPVEIPSGYGQYAPTEGEEAPLVTEPGGRPVIVDEPSNGWPPDRHLNVVVDATNDEILTIGPSQLPGTPPDCPVGEEPAPSADEN